MFQSGVDLKTFNPENTKECKVLCTNSRPTLLLYREKRDLLPYIDCESSVEILDHHSPNHKLTRCILPKAIQTKFVVPINYSLESKLLWLAGFLDGDGSTKRKGNVITGIQTNSTNRPFLCKIVLMLQTMGCLVNCGIERVGGEKNIRGRTFISNNISALNIHGEALQVLLNLGFNPHRLNLTEFKHEKDISKTISVTKITDLNEEREVWWPIFETTPCPKLKAFWCDVCNCGVNRECDMVKHLRSIKHSKSAELNKTIYNVSFVANGVLFGNPNYK
jgi:hypothetical protein